jgi:hypothetical protein
MYQINKKEATMRRSAVVLSVVIWLWAMVLPLWAADLDFSGNYRVRGFSTQNLTDQNDDIEDDTAYYSSRFFLTARAIQDKVQGVATLILGHDNNTGNRLLGNDAFGPTDGGPGDFFGLLEAYIRADLEMTGFAAGRQVFKLGHSIILEDPADAILIDHTHNGLKVGAAAAKLVELSNSANNAIGNTTDTGHSQDADLYILDVMWGDPKEFGLEAFAAYLNDRGPNLFVTDPADTQLALVTIGVAVDGMVGAIGYNGEVDFLSGSISRSAGDEPDLAGLNVVLGGRTEVGPAMVGLTLIYASGQDPDETDEINVNGIDGNYPVGIIITNGGARSLAPKDGTCLSINGASLGGVPNCIGGLGLTAVKLSGSAMVMEKTVVGLDVIWAQSSEDNPATEESAIGIELDGTAKYNFTDSLHLLGGVGYLIADDFFGEEPDDMYVLVAELGYAFQ